MQAAVPTQMAKPAAIRGHSLGDIKVFQKKDVRRSTLAARVPMFAFAQKMWNGHLAPK
jgi:hypothetical protein